MSEHNGHTLADREIASRIERQRPKLVAGSAVRCAICGVRTKLEPFGEGFRCQSCRSAIDRHGSRLAVPSFLMPSRKKSRAA